MTDLGRRTKHRNFLRHGAKEIRWLFFVDFVWEQGLIVNNKNNSKKTFRKGSKKNPSDVKNTNYICNCCEETQANTLVFPPCQLSEWNLLTFSWARMWYEYKYIKVARFGSQNPFRSRVSLRRVRRVRAQRWYSYFRNFALSRSTLSWFLSFAWGRF